MPKRTPMPDERASITHRAMIGGAKVYLTAGKYPSGRLGEIFIEAGKEGSPLRMLLKAVGMATSRALQMGDSLSWHVAQHIGGRCEPNGLVTKGAPEIESCTSLLDYTFRWLALRFPEADAVDPPFPYPTDPDQIIGMFRQLPPEAKAHVLQLLIAEK